ncbi:hypothetical protein CPB84DRAFT_246038 [Gymnopilus junonius]|uniref:Uncharacterized protein n=1 Tax=Gymnopilus junonius TaxID=109634 RepID=A0A9P5NTC6_GYMJU|nr:hypothetical protein CPB84DRAFT_246038 [Gymnopilus junonius]
MDLLLVKGAAMREIILLLEALAGIHAIVSMILEVFVLYFDLLLWIVFHVLVSDTYPPGPSGPSYDDRYVPGPPADRGRLPPAGYNASYSRVRPRSPSPIRRGPGPPDDSRPPLKRAREDYPPDYYTPNSGGRRPSDYPGPPPRSGSPGPPPSSSGWGGPPPPPPPTTGSSASSMGVGPPHSHPSSGDRDYRMGREPPMDYGPPPGGYDRPRSPGPPGPPGGGGRMPYNRGGGGGYGRGGEPRDRGGYGVPRP